MNGEFVFCSIPFQQLHYWDCTFLFTQRENWWGFPSMYWYGLMKRAQAWNELALTEAFLLFTCASCSPAALTGHTTFSPHEALELCRYKCWATILGIGSHHSMGMAFVWEGLAKGRPSVLTEPTSAIVSHCSTALCNAGFHITESSA